ncbi:protein O-mannosyltransferase 1 [Cimex lectularius]|uniref:Protein O-mannosyltransferase 1 n=1 Tax=Cimex lectularius TaxID=79782 RepID=A0A8I6RR89_CIMLE|nr:protein O-mannosyltransferase 1 [Cimex lectularius]
METSINQVRKRRGKSSNNGHEKQTGNTKNTVRHGKRPKDSDESDDGSTCLEEFQQLVDGETQGVSNDVSSTERAPSFPKKRFLINLELDVVAVFLFGLAAVSRFYKLDEPRHIVFDELHYGKYIGLYIKNTFFFDLHPPLGKLLISSIAQFAGFDGKFRFDRIGTAYDETVPIFALRFLPALCGSLIVPTSYFLMLELRCQQWTAMLAALLVLFDNALLTQSRFILMEPMLLLLTLLGLLSFLKFRRYTNNFKHPMFWIWLSTCLTCLSLALCVKYVGFFSLALGVTLMWMDFWRLLPRKDLTDRILIFQGAFRWLLSLIIPAVVYVSVFYVHLILLYKAGPHDSVMTSAFQASLEGGLASITKGQPLEVAHGSQITLRHTHGKACWLHSHNAVYPLRYPDKRGSSHQQQVTCYTFKDLNNWWIVTRPNEANLVVSTPPDAIKHGDIIQLVHGMTGRSLNSHDVSGPMSPHNQEVSCYIDYNVSMPAQDLWKVEIVNREEEGDVWHTIQSQVRLIHFNSSQALKYSGKQLPNWGFNQMEVVTDKVTVQDNTVWNVEEHRYTKFQDEKERERDMMNAEMIPMTATQLPFYRKFLELQYKMLFTTQENLQSHMYSSDPVEWLFMTRGIAYWVSSNHNGQVHLLGNVLIWYSGTVSLVIYLLILIFYLLRRRRLIYDLSPVEWEQYKFIGQTLFMGFLFHYIPYFFVDRTLFLHHYFPAFLFKILLTAAVIEHIHSLTRHLRFLQALFTFAILVWIIGVVIVFKIFSVISYGATPLSGDDILKLRWSESWDFIVHKE